MCGIYGTVLRARRTEKAQAGELVFEGLKRLEYRGYDSWGVVVPKDGKFLVTKKVGKIALNPHQRFISSRSAIGHTRWATHGGVTETNAHPHVAKNDSFALVQNGVVENYQELKKELLKQGYEFKSETDTEVIVGLIETLAEKKKEMEPSLTTIRAAFQQLAGRNTIAVLLKNEHIIAIRNGSPLVACKDKRNNFYISSDVLTASQDATEYVMIDHSQGVEIQGEKVHFFDVATGKDLPLEWQPITVVDTRWDASGYEHFTLKEIHEQASVLKNVLEQPDELWKKLETAIKRAEVIYTVGAGSASFAAGNLAFCLREKGINAEVIRSYEARGYRKLFNKKSLGVIFSQSGETADTNEVVEWMKAVGMRIVSIVNMPGSTLTAMSYISNVLQVGPEVSVAGTKALTGHFLWGTAVAEVVDGANPDELKEQVDDYQYNLNLWLLGSVPDKIKRLAQRLKNHQHLFVLGRGQLYMSSLEFALKMKELSYIHAEGFSGGELKHGVIALVEKGTPVISLIGDDDETADMLNATAEVKARGAWTIGVSAKNNELFDDWIDVPMSSYFPAISAVIPAQLLTYYLAILKGYDPDKPRNLAKSVTVK